MNLCLCTYMCEQVFIILVAFQWNGYHTPCQGSALENLRVVPNLMMVTLGRGNGPGGQPPAN